MRHVRPFLALPLLAVLAACGPQVYAPPLDVRPIEREPIGLPVGAREPADVVDPELATALSRQVTAAEEGDRRFDQLRAEARRAAMRGARAEPGSEEWTVEQQALTALVAGRGPVKDAAQEVETLRAAPANAGPTARTAIEQAARRIEALDTREEQAIAALSAEGR